MMYQTTGTHDPRRRRRWLRVGGLFIAASLGALAGVGLMGGSAPNSAPRSELASLLRDWLGRHDVEEAEEAPEVPGLEFEVCLINSEGTRFIVYRRE